jgi:hypothetical protein
MIGIQKEIMPHVRFEQKDWGVNADATKETGISVPNRSTFIIVTSHGSKDAPEFLADEWLKRKREEAHRGNYSMEWVEHFEKQYEAWKKGHELPRNGTPILTWQAISQEQNARLRALGYTVIEDLAALPDTSLGSLGLDGRSMRDMARAWLNEGKDKGVNAQLIAAQAVTIEQQGTTIEDLKQQIAELRAQIGEKRGPGRPPKQEAA